jgi:NlpC/P60 family putative phage cell wall peptidase
MSRARIVREARRWIGTPYRHQASCRGAGCDCLGLVRGIWRALYGAEPERLPPYTPDWAEVAGRETLRDAAMRHLIEIDRTASRPGDVLLFRPDLNGPAKHCAILSKPDRIIHAYWGRAVAETALSRWWRRRQVAAFAFPERDVGEGEDLVGQVFSRPQPGLAPESRARPFRPGLGSGDPG